VIRENHTYDRVLGDLPQGNGDPWPDALRREESPSTRSREFVLFDHFYVDAEVSNDGHAYSMAAYATDAVEKLWPTLYGQRGGLYLSEGGHEIRNNYGNPRRRRTATSGTSPRAPGCRCAATEFASWETKGGQITAGSRARGQGTRAIRPTTCRSPTTSASTSGSRSSAASRRDGGLPELNSRLGGDHPRHLPADPRRAHSWPKGLAPAGWSNDLAEPLLAGVMIFVLEDDAQVGPTTWTHRSVLLVASPWTKRGSVDSTLYTTSGVLRTMEPVLGLPPMSCTTPRRRRPSLPRDEERSAPYTARSARPARRDEPARRARGPGLLEMNLIADLAPRARAQRDRLEVDPRPRRRDARARPGGVRQADRGGRRRRGRGRGQGREGRAALNNKLTDRSRESGIPPNGRSEIPD
jgi:hypothetical protein